MEHWKDVVGYEGFYQVSSLGGVRSLSRVVSYKGGTPRKLKSVLLKQSVSKSGYYCAGLTKDGKTIVHNTHRLILEAFRGPCPVGCESLHRNGIKTDIVLGNLRWGTSKENADDRIIHGQQTRGERHGSGKLTEKKIKLIRLMYRRKELNQRELGEKFGVHQVQISRIICGKQWGWL